MARSIFLLASTALLALTALPSPARADDGSQKPMSNTDADGASTISDDYECTHPPYKVHIVSKSPSVLYITDFVTPEERLHLQEITKSTFSHSRVQQGQPGSSHPSSNSPASYPQSSARDSNGILHAVRTSQSTTAPPSDPVVKCISQRALSFQGLSPSSSSSSSSSSSKSSNHHDQHLEPLQLVKYAKGEHYHYHTDWFTDPSLSRSSQGGNRVSSFFAYVKVDDVTGGGTNFPLLEDPSRGSEARGPGEEEQGGQGGRGRGRGDGENGDKGEWWWCRYVDCDEEYENGLTFLPLEGNAVYWENLRPENGQGDQRTLHAGLPVTSGEKIGMNIWTRQLPLPEELRGGQANEGVKVSG
ncbi:hypothetical protein MKZ38_006317 [Zalerion maritima]|uniref:Fe2OG dioxygenase domain-containing protein n=1 Tax=Zalerion maritima TaxID=339359 RepID=A0AAD5RJ06_9PEZI|nr:hypothetical protein MKZ38_006317 [Zalerion maritima]